MDFGFLRIGGGRGGSLFLPAAVDSVSVSSASPVPSSSGELDPSEGEMLGTGPGETFGLPTSWAVWNVPRLRDDRGD